MKKRLLNKFFYLYLTICFFNYSYSQTARGISSQDYAYKHSTAIIRHGNNLYTAERDYRVKRLPKIKLALEKMFDTELKLESVPIIAIVASGGGYRAMNGLMGSLLGAQKIGLFDACMYISSLSGSTWLVAPWIMSGLSLKDYKKSLKEKVANNSLFLSPSKLYLAVKALMIKKYYKQQLNLVDFYGALLANILLSEHGDNCHQIGLSEQAKMIEAADHPFPIYSAIRAEPFASSQWYEFTPYEIGAGWLEKFVPTWAYGRVFDNGVSVDSVPEQGLGFHLGTFGSVMGANIGNIFEYLNNTLIEEGLPGFFEQAFINELRQKRFTWAEVNNFARNIPNSPISNLEKLCLIDGGARPGFNVPYPPVSGERPERKADVIIIVDYSYPLAGASELRKAEEYAREHKLKFPIINYSNIDKRLISIFKDVHDPEVPIVIYMPLYHDEANWSKTSTNLSPAELKKFKKYLDNFDLEKEMSSGFCSTFNFKYSNYEFEQLTALTEYAMQTSLKKIKEAIWDAIKRKEQKSNLDFAEMASIVKDQKIILM